MLQVEKNTAKLTVIITLAAIILLYAGFEARNILSGPSLTVLAPASGSTVHDSYVEIKGSTKRIDKIYLNDRQIFTRDDGSFDEPLILSYGYNIIGVRVEDQFGRKIEKDIQLVFK